MKHRTTHGNHATKVAPFYFFSVFDAFELHCEGNNIRYFYSCILIQDVLFVCDLSAEESILLPHCGAAVAEILRSVI